VTRGRLRIVAGELGGRRISAPAGRATRPTADRVREALFSILGDVTGEEVIDLYAGSGALGLEALSRGAARATFVEQSPAALAAIRQNIADLGLEERASVVVGDVEAVIRREATSGRRYRLCLLDPPYSLLSRISGALGPLLAPVLEPGARVVVEHSARTQAPDFAELPIVTRTHRTYGDTTVTILGLANP